MKYTGNFLRYQIVQNWCLEQGWSRVVAHQKSNSHNIKNVLWINLSKNTSNLHTFWQQFCRQNESATRFWTFFKYGSDELPRFQNWKEDMRAHKCWIEWRDLQNKFPLIVYSVFWFIIKLNKLFKKATNLIFFCKMCCLINF